MSGTTTAHPPDTGAPAQAQTPPTWTTPTQTTPAQTAPAQTGPVGGTAAPPRGVGAPRTPGNTGSGAGVGSGAARPDGGLKVTGAFAYSSDLRRDDAVWGATLRSPHPSARVLSLDASRARALPGVRAVLTHEDVPGLPRYGMKVADQPVLASDRVRYQGEPVALVAADHPETARRALALIDVRYVGLPALTDPEAALRGEGPLVHETHPLGAPTAASAAPAGGPAAGRVAPGNLVRHVRIRHGDVARARARADVVVAGVYETGMQDQAFLGPESVLVVPAEDGGVEAYVASQWIHDDQRQMAASLGLPVEKVRVRLSGVGGAFGGREDVSCQIHAAMLALRTGRPVRMSYGRRESFLGHVHRHPSRMRVEHGATREGRLLYMTARLLLDGGAYTSTSPVVTANASYFAAGAYEVPNVAIDGFAVYTNNPPCGAMRGFGAVQSCFGVESGMDRLAGRLGMHPVELRERNAMRTGTVLPTGQPVDGPAPVAELLRRLRDRPLPPPAARDGQPEASPARPGGLNNTTHGEGVRRGVGYAVGVKAIGFSGGVDDRSTAHVRLLLAGGEPVAEIRSAAAECGQGIVTVQAQIARTELGVERVVVLPADTSAGDAGSSSASRLTWMSGGAVRGACRAVRERLRARGTGPPAALLAEGPVEAEFTYAHRRTEPVDPERGQGAAHIAFAFAAHRAVVDVDVELGLVKVVELACAQDVGKAMNPIAVHGQIEGGTAQGLGLALLEELRVEGGRIRNGSFTDYLIPTIADMPPVPTDLLELPHPDSPYGLNGVGEPPTLSSTPALANALRDATGLRLPRVPVRPEEIIDAAEGR
ncbi:molybdopterin-dependent oxidoreductase [Streptomyces tubbatahanensis]|uniref:Molybdopterin-dependent oxidoreductase n=1 Tax=Streptomyces tubbatahanensis TaxID=2923272 RepID=A0ABY3XM14_9ACTN|nr:molybdopterin cofactor-binding domain-containing protein [Streptomyces tubbatahanensis]UNS95453.1 molybdopterin-dependent oxidoreductase [Streptomyces tubbatahanensis]